MMLLQKKKVPEGKKKTSDNTNFMTTQLRFSFLIPQQIRIRFFDYGNQDMMHDDL
jgi:hypothetical protein